MTSMMSRELPGMENFHAGMERSRHTQYTPIMPLARSSLEKLRFPTMQAKCFVMPSPIAT